MEMVENGNDLEDTKAAFGEDEKSRLEMEKGCSLKTQEWEEIKKTIAEELVALADAFQVLNDDDALELFKKTLPTAGVSFVEMKVSTANMVQVTLSSAKWTVRKPSQMKIRN